MAIVQLRAFVRDRIGGLPRPFWVLWGGTLINRIGLLVEPFLALYLSGRRLSLAQIGLVLAASGFGAVFSQLIGGALADRIGRRATLTIGMLANSAALLALGYAHGMTALLVATLAVGLTIDMYRPAASALIADLVPQARRVRAYGLLFWAVNLGFSAAMVLGGSLAGAGFIWLFWADAGTCAMFGLLVWWAVPETHHRDQNAAGNFIDVLRDPLMVAFCLLTLASETVYMQAYTTLPLAVRASGLSAQSYGLAMAVNGIVIVLLQPVLAGGVARRTPSRVLAAGMLLFGAGFGLTSLASATWSYAVTVGIWTLGEILTSAVGPAMVANFAPEHLRGRYNGVFGVMFSMGSLIAPLAGTRLLAAGGPVLWLSCAGVCAATAAGQLTLGPAIRRREATLADESRGAESTAAK